MSLSQLLYPANCRLHSVAFLCNSVRPVNKIIVNPSSSRSLYNLKLAGTDGASAISTHLLKEASSKISDLCPHAINKIKKPEQHISDISVANSH